MSIVDWSGAIKITFDLPIISVVRVLGWTVSGEELTMQPDGTLAAKTYTVYHVTKSVDGLEITLWLDMYHRMMAPDGLVTVAYNKTLGNLLGQGNMHVESFSLTFTPLRKMTNLITDGDFPSTAGWSTENGSVSVTNNIATFLKSTANTGKLFQTITMIPLHKIYVSVLSKVTTYGVQVCIGDDAYYNNTMYNLPENADYMWRSGVTTLPAVILQAQNQIKIIDYRETFDNVYIKYIKIIDLTKDFCGGVVGTGLEPTGPEMDAILLEHFPDTSWFDGTTGLIPIINPHEPENLTALVQSLVTVSEVNYLYARSPHEYIIAILDIDITVTKVGDLPL